MILKEPDDPSQYIAEMERLKGAAPPSLHAAIPRFRNWMVSAENLPEV
jgi:hypothetical protein